MSQEAMTRTRPAPNSLGGLLWFGGWLFTIAFAKLGVGKAILGLVIWPYYLAIAIR